MFRKLPFAPVSALAVVAVVTVVITAMGSITTFGTASKDLRPHPHARPTHSHGHHSGGPKSPATSPSSPATSPSDPPTSPSDPPTSPSSPATSPSSPATSPSSPATSPSSPATSASSSWSCVETSPSGNCGAYDFSGIVNSNGYNTYVGNNCWADPTCKQTISANSPADWQVVANEPQGNTGVKTYPDVQQLFNNWCGTRWNGCASPTDTPISALAGLSFSYSLTMPPASSGTIAQAAYDIWTTDPNHNEIMIWVDNDNRGSGGATFDASYTTSDGQDWSLYHYGGEIIWSLGAKGTFAQQASMSDVPVYELMKYLVDHGYEQATAKVGQLDFGWEICSTGGVPQTFAVTGYAISAR